MIFKSIDLLIHHHGVSHFNNTDSVLQKSIEKHARNYFLPLKSIKSYIFLVRALFIQHIILLSVTCLDLPYFSTFSHKLLGLRKKSY
jgi:hypothetical protein